MNRALEARSAHREKAKLLRRTQRGHVEDLSKEYQKCARMAMAGSKKAGGGDHVTCAALRSTVPEVVKSFGALLRLTWAYAVKPKGSKTRHGERKHADE